MLFFKKNLFFSKKYFQAVKELFQIPSIGLNLKRPPIKASRHPLVNTFFEVFFNQSIFFKEPRDSTESRSFQIEKAFH